MFYEQYCKPCDHAFLVNKPMDEAHIPELCPICDLEAMRLFSYFQLHMQTMVGEGLRRTTEIPDELKPGVKRIQDSKPIMSYPGAPAKRKKAMQ